jgi:hypothetical protein
LALPARSPALRDEGNALLLSDFTRTSKNPQKPSSPSYFPMKGSSLFAFSCKDQKGKGEYDDTEQKEEDD